MRLNLRESEHSRNRHSYIARTLQCRAAFGCAALAVLDLKNTQKQSSNAAAKNFETSVSTGTNPP
jgi:hypothetical protein